MNVRGVRGRLAGVVGAAVLLAGVGLAGTATGALAGGSGNAVAPAAVQPISANAALAIGGAWTLTTDWDCDGTVTGSFAQTFNADGSWTSSGYSGRWFQVGDTVVWTFTTVPNLVYTGSVNGSWISGAQGYTAAGGAKGCFGGHLSSVPGLAAAAGKADAVIGR